MSILKYTRQQVQKEIAVWKETHEEQEMEDYPLLDCVEHMELEQLPGGPEEPQNEPQTEQEAELQVLGLEGLLY